MIQQTKDHKGVRNRHRAQGRDGHGTQDNVPCMNWGILSTVEFHSTHSLGTSVSGISDAWYLVFSPQVTIKQVQKIDKFAKPSLSSPPIHKAAGEGDGASPQFYKVVG